MGRVSDSPLIHLIRLGTKMFFKFRKFSLPIWRISKRAHSRNFNLEKLESNRFVRTRAKAIELDDVHEVLKQEGALDVCVIKVPLERKYVEHFIVCTARDASQLISVPTVLSELCRQKTGERKRVEGLGTADKPPNWTVIDLSNIVVHCMTEEIRAQYDLETLWAL